MEQSSGCTTWVLLIVMGGFAWYQHSKQEDRLATIETRLAVLEMRATRTATELVERESEDATHSERLSELSDDLAEAQNGVFDIQLACRCAQ